MGSLGSLINHKMTYIDRVRNVLHKNEFSHKFLVKYAYECAMYANSFGSTRIASECLNLVEQWLHGKNITTDELMDAAREAYQSFTVTPSEYARNAAARAAYAAAGRMACSHAAHAAYAANQATHPTYEIDEERGKHYYDLLINMINNMSELEKLLLDIKL